MNKQLPMEFFKELTLMTIQKDARWMEYVEGMEDLELQGYFDESIADQLSLFLVGYIPQLDMELALQVFEEDRKGLFFSTMRGTGEMKQQEFSMADFQADFEMNMLVYAANTQILNREMEESYNKVMDQLIEAKSGCAGCSGCH